jgi:heme/copper-type cytochrome/quinol oxidase subunit 3
MSTLAISYPERGTDWRLPSRGRVGMYCLIAAEAAIFTIFVVAYLFYLGKSAERIEILAMYWHFVDAVWVVVFTVVYVIGV